MIQIKTNNSIKFGYVLALITYLNLFNWTFKPVLININNSETYFGLFIGSYFTWKTVIFIAVLGISSIAMDIFGKKIGNQLNYLTIILFFLNFFYILQFIISINKNESFFNLKSIYMVCLVFSILHAMLELVIYEKYFKLLSYSRNNL